MKRLIALLLASILSTTCLTGCYGKFGLTRTLYKANGSLPDKYLRSGLTWVFIIFPVYEFAALLDFIVFNTIEFWSGNNPVAAGEKDLHYVSGDDSWDIHVKKQNDTVTMDIRHNKNGRLVDTMTVTSDTVTGYTTAAHHRNGTDTHYAAWRSMEGVTVRSENGMTVIRG